MTTLQLGSKITRKTSAVVQSRPLVITLHPGYMELRQERTRHPLTISYDAIYRYAARLAADKAIAERKEQRRAKKL
jgi:hypothetical protein